MQRQPDSQVLADYALLLNVLRSERLGLGPVVAWGGSYGGMLAAYFQAPQPTSFESTEGGRDSGPDTHGATRVFHVSDTHRGTTVVC